MKILLVTTTFDTVTHGPAKFAQFVWQINNLFLEHEVRILTEDSNQKENRKIYEMSTYFLPKPFGILWPYLDNFRYFKKIKEIKKVYKFDVLLFNNAILGWWSAWRKNSEISVVGMLNDDDYLSTRLSNFDGRKKWFIDYHRKPLEYLAAKALDKVITNSNYLHREVIQSYFCSAEKVFRLYKSVDILKYEFRGKRKINLNNIISILFVKSDYPRGGLALLLKALSILSPLKFVVTVMGPLEKERQIISNFFSSSPNVQLDFRGPCSQDEVSNAMQKKDILCVPSHKEGLGVVNMEGLSIGIPVVSTDVGGIPEVLDNGKNGWLAQPNNPEELSKAIYDCMIQEDERYIKSKNGHAFVHRHFDYLQMLKELLLILQPVPGNI